MNTNMIATALILSGIVLLIAAICCAGFGNDENEGGWIIAGLLIAALSAFDFMLSGSILL